MVRKGGRTGEERCRSGGRRKVDQQCAVVTRRDAGLQHPRIAIEFDGEPQAVTKDLQEDRMTFEVESEVVVGCTVG